jgi:hypothetical protein
VHHVQRVHRRQPRRGLAQQQPQRLDGQRSALHGEGLGQGEPGDVGGGEPGRPGGAVTGEQRRGGLFGEPLEIVQFLSEAAQEVLVLGDDRGQQLLDRRVPPLVHAEVDPSHAPGTEPAEQRDRPDPRRVPVLQRLGPTAVQLQHACPVSSLCDRDSVGQRLLELEVVSRKQFQKAVVDRYERAT